MGEPLAVITIPKFITQVCISQKRRAKYYKKGKAVPPTYLKKYNFSKKGFLVDENGKKVLANPRSAGKAKYEVLSGNNLLSGYGSPHTRAKLVRELKNFYRPFVQKDIKENGEITQFPLRVEWELYTTVEANPNWDASNLFFYWKYFEDCLFEHSKRPHLLSLIPDDNVKYITHPPGAKIIPIDDWNDRKFVFKFYYDDRNELKREPWQSNSTANI
jgi:hypothetical protein